jgi:uncharacterized protein YerC
VDDEAVPSGAWLVEKDTRAIDATRQALLVECVKSAYPQAMTKAPDTAYDSLVSALESIDDLVERYRCIKSIEDRFEADMKQMKAALARTLYEGRTWAQVGELLGVTGARAEQISRAAR